MDRINETAFPRVGLAGNPSDLYGGRGLGFTFDAWRVELSLEPAEALDLGAGDEATAPLTELLQAGWDEFRERAGDLAEPDPLRGTPAGDGLAGCLRADDGPFELRRDGRPWWRLRPFRVRVTTTIPRQAGLSGSSAILIALLRALARGAGVRLPPHRLAQLAMRTEVERLGIRAGPLDRLVQAHEGLIAMDFARPWDPAACARLDATLPPLLLAVDPSPGRSSGDVHGPVFARWQAGDADVLACLDGWRAVSAAAREALRRGDHEALADAMTRNVTLRQRLFEPGEGDRRALDVARAHGAGAKLCGSGGAVLALAHDSASREALAAAWRADGRQVIEPRVVGPAAPRGHLRAVVLAAGFATRLHPLTKTCAKPLLELGGVPLLTRLVRQLGATGVVDDVVVVTNGRFHADFEAWSDGLVMSPVFADAHLPDVHLVCDGVTDDTANLGAIADLQLALAEAPAPAAPLDGYVILAGDNLLDMPLEPYARRLLQRQVTQLVVRRLPEPVPPKRYAEVSIDAAGRVAAFREKPADPRTPLSALPIYFMTPELPDLVDAYLRGDGAERDAPGHLLAWLSQRGPMETSPVSGRWFDIGNIEQLQAARAWVEGPGHDGSATS